MYLLILKWTLTVLVLPSSVVFSREDYDNMFTLKHVIRISMKYGNDSRECLQNGGPLCKSLNYVFKHIREQNSTEVHVEPGDYYLNQTYTFLHVNQISIIGLTNLIPYFTDEVKVKCLANASLAFIHSSEIVMKNLTLLSCGGIQNSTSKEHPKFLTGLFLVNCIHLSMDWIHIRDAPGIGMQLYDVTGTVSISNSSFINNGRRKKNGLETSFPGGGGLYFEFTYMGGLFPFDTPPKQMYQENGMFHFSKVYFEGNTAPDSNISVPTGGNNHYAFGRGGGASFFIKGFAKNNTFIFENSFFDQNAAEWGAGLFTEFQDKTKGNRFIFQTCHFSENKASLAGGGMRIGLITMHQNSSCRPNSVIFKYCQFKFNTAKLGGGISLYVTTKQSYLDFPDESFINLTHCVIEGNKATFGSGFFSALWNTNQYGVGVTVTLKICITNSHIKGNLIVRSNVLGVGALYAQGTPILLNNTVFFKNNGTALVLDNARVKVNGNVSFIKNIGQKGGAMSLYGVSKITVTDKASLSYIENNASVKGGAIYVRTPGPQMGAFKTTQLKIHDCFFKNVGNCSVSFYGNLGLTPASGNSIYATTLNYCRQPNEGIVNNSTLQGKSFHYCYANGTKKYDMAYEIVTDAVNIELLRHDWNTTPDKSFSPVVKLSDEKSNNVYGVLKVEVHSESKVTLYPPSTYFLAKDKIESLQIIAKPKTHYNINLVTVDSQQLFYDVVNAVIQECEPGFYWKGSSCECDRTKIAVSRCDNEKQTLFLLKGYWAGYHESSEKFVITPCPKNYCYCNQSNLTSSGECLFVEGKQCKANRERQVCGKCKRGFSLILGDDECTSDCNSGSTKWIGYVFGILIILTLLVLFIMMINFDPFSAYLNAWLYFYQVLPILIPSSIKFDSFLSFIVGLAHFRIVGFGGICLWSSMDDLQKLAFNYLLPVYFFLCLCVLNKVVVAWPHSFFTRRFTQTSMARAFCTLFVLSYSTVVDVSLKILTPINVGGNYFVYYQGYVEYFGSCHAGFAVFALILVIFIGLLFPLVLLRRQWFQSFDKGLTKLLLDNFQKCFRDGYKWFAGFYFVSRFILLVIGFFPLLSAALRFSLLNSVCCIILTVFVLCKPYTDDGGTVVPYNILNISDAILLCNLCLISNFGSASSGIYLRSSNEKFKILIFLLSYIPLLFSFSLVIYVLRHRYTTTRDRLLNEVDE